MSYVKKQVESNMRDYEELEIQMKERNAPPLQLKQLEEIKKLFLQFCLKVKEESQVL